MQRERSRHGYGRHEMSRGRGRGRGRHGRHRVRRGDVRSAVLALLDDRPMHGYELHQQIQAEGIDVWFNVSMAGVYYSLGKLRDRGLVAESRQRGRRSVRKSIYRLTDEGRAAFF